ncbi:MAG: PorT family protein [Saprospiraceae bacterium]|nr:PorT family protein [Saprospiraceae bacterium]
MSKKSIFIFFCLLLLAYGTLSAQNKIQYGFSGGFNLTRMVNKQGLDTTRYRPFFSPTVGGFVSVNLYKGLYLDCHLNYSLSGGIDRIKTDSFRIRERLSHHHIYIPTTLKYTYKNFIYLRFGTYFSFLTNAYTNQRFIELNDDGKIENFSKQRIRHEDLKDEFNPFDYGFILGGGLQFADGFSIELSYRQGFQPVRKQDQLYNSVFSIGLNYTINYSHKAIYKFGLASRHVFYTEIGGAGIAGSMNYEYVIAQHSNLRLAGRVGLGFVPFANLSSDLSVSFPTGLIGILGKKNHHIEFGFIHTTLAKGSDISNFAFLSGGYRFHKPGGGFFLRIAYTPMIANYNLQRFNHWAGISIGYVLKTKSIRP